MHCAIAGAWWLGVLYACARVDLCFLQAVDNVLAVRKLRALLLTGGNDGRVVVWSLTSGTFGFWSTTIGHSGAIESLAWDPNHCRLASAGDGHLQVWNLTPDKTFMPMVSQPEKQAYVACTIHFYDKGASLLVSYL
ncbi:hypothetical protein BDR07DRAFT_1373976 [Suillus spraguei]|nr:hypothetical protein BDR07DRAFT_1373976 [Suillus spraguei]